MKGAVRVSATMQYTTKRQNAVALSVVYVIVLIELRSAPADVSF